MISHAMSLPCAVLPAPFAPTVPVQAPRAATPLELALKECESLTRHAAYFKNPTLPPTEGRIISTAWTWVQRLRGLVSAFNDTRTLKETNPFTMHGPLGPLPMAVERAIARHGARGNIGIAPILEIGAGQRLVAAGLKMLYGDAIALHESSPTYAERFGNLLQPLPAASIEDAALPENTFELAYSFYGSIYAKDQVRVLNNVVKSLRVGGEFLLMWKTSFRNNALARLAYRWPAVFAMGGLDIETECDTFKAFSDLEKIHVVWGRKCNDEVNVAALFEEARLHHALYKGAPYPTSVRRQIRLSRDGPYIPCDHVSDYDLIDMMAQMIERAAAMLKVSGIELHRAIIGGPPQQKYVTPFDLLARAALANNFRPCVSSYDALVRHIPLSAIALRKVIESIPLLGTDSSLPGQLNNDVIQMKLVS